MSQPIFRLPPSRPGLTVGAGILSMALLLAGTAMASSGSEPAVVPGYVPPVRQTPVASYADDTRGVYVPGHAQLRSKTNAELAGWSNEMSDGSKPIYAQKNPGSTAYEKALNDVAGGDTKDELDRIGEDPGLLAGGGRGGSMENLQLAQNTASGGSMRGSSPSSPGKSFDSYPSLATGGKSRGTDTPPDLGAAEPKLPMAGSGGTFAAGSSADGGVELAVGGQGPGPSGVDLQNGLVRLKEERISVRRALQRMLDQVGGNSWSVVWDLDEVNAGLPDMEISIYAEEPFVKVLNALLARLQTRSGQPLRVIKYEKTQRLVITDRVGGATGGKSGSVGVGDDKLKGVEAIITEAVLKDATVSLHYDEVPLVDALENMVNQAGKGQWRLRMYAGTDQVLKPAHIEEPFGVAIERVLKIFNLRYEVFPGGKLIVVTGSNKFGFKGIE